MPIETRCPACKSRVSVPERYYGRSVKCSKCLTVFSAPALTEEKIPVATLADEEEIPVATLVDEEEIPVATLAKRGRQPRRDGRRSAVGETERERKTVGSPRRYDPREFHDGYWRVLAASIPVALAVAVGDSIPFPGLSVFTQLAGALLFVVLTSVFLYGAWAQIQDGGVRTTPARAVWLRFIPFFSLYWEFVAFKGLVSD
jgi:predicted Zn finger-like uncharacterized protein